MSVGETFLTFAYGSNMLTARLRERCPSALPLGVAELKGYELRWHKRSRDGSGKCDIVASVDPAARVLGVVYRIAHADRRELDIAEGRGAGYELIEVQVLQDAAKVVAAAYQATRTDAALKPYTWYHAFVLAGAREHGLPSDYIARIEAVAADLDPDRARHEKNVRLLKEAPA